MRMGTEVGSCAGFGATGVINGGTALVLRAAQPAMATSGVAAAESSFCGALPEAESPAAEQLPCAKSAVWCPGGQCGQSAGAGTVG